MILKDLLNVVRNSTSSIKLSHTTRGNTWEIKIRGSKGKEEDLVEELEELNKKMEILFGEEK